MTMHFSSQSAELFGTEPAEIHKDAQQPETGVYRNYIKRFIDLALTVVSLPLIVPMVAIMAMLVALDGHNPFYSQLRIGRDGRRFRMWKLRSMVFNAEALLEKHLTEDPEARAEWDSTQKLKKDPRITFVGRFLRKSSMDELPQLFNVLNGTMSLIGPRPMMVNQESSYTGRAYYRLRPGLTGLWQVSDRNHCQFIGRVSYDERYDQELSMRLDLQILWRTVAVVLRGTGY